MSAPEDSKDMAAAEGFVIFEDMTEEEQRVIRESIPLGLVEVYCPWWPEGKWEIKEYGAPWNACYYRLVSPTT